MDKVIKLIQTCGCERGKVLKEIIAGEMIFSCAKKECRKEFTLKDGEFLLRN
jgi:hypothetical protein